MVRWEVERAPTSVALLLGLGADHGVPARACLEGTGLVEEKLRGPGATVSPRQELAVIQNLLRALGDPPGLGMEAGVRYHLTTYGIWGYALISSPSWRSAMEVGLRFIDLTFAFSRIRARERSGETDMVFDAPDVPLGVRRFAIERDAAAVHTMQSELLVTDSSVTRVSFEFEPPADLARCTQIFGVVPEFGAGENCLEFDHELLHRPLPQANEHTAAIAEEQCRQLLATRHARSGMAGRVRDQLMARPAHPPSLEQVAVALSMSG